MQDIQQPLWQPSPSRLASTHLTTFIHLARTLWQLPLADYEALWQASIDDSGRFWSLLWDYSAVIGEKKGAALINAESMLNARFFPDAVLNYAENLLRWYGDGVAVVFYGEDKVKYQWSWDELHAEVSRLQQAMQAIGITAGDRVAGFIPNMPHALAAMLATASLGAIWTSCSPDFGVKEVLDRFGQTAPKLLFCPDGYWYNNKKIDISMKLQEIAQGLRSVVQIVIVPYIGNPTAFARALRHALPWAEFVAPYRSTRVAFLRLPFNHPLFILYSSGTTGQPKCIVHGAGGTLLQHLKEHQLHADIHQQDRLFYFTTCGWMMWNWLVSGLASGATLLLYDGSPFARQGHLLWQYAQDWQCSHFGTSARYIDGLRKLDFQPGQHYQLDSLRTLFSTGSVLSAENYDWVYRAFKADLNLASISGGTDIVSCFALGSANLPVYRGELQCRGLGMAVDIIDQQGRSVREQKGELVCTKPFPSMPVSFWGDANGSLYRNTYFGRFKDIWCHGDYAEITRHGGVIIYGRSDTTLNPGGVRIGTAEIYRQVETLDEILESIAVGQRWEDDERVLLFVRLKDNTTLDEQLIATIKERIRNGASPRHVPARIIQVSDIPRTINGKLVELAVKNVIHGEPVSNLTSLANPEALKLFEGLLEVQR